MLRSLFPLLRFVACSPTSATGEEGTDRWIRKATWPGFEPVVDAAKLSSIAKFLPPEQARLATDWFPRWRLVKRDVQEVLAIAGNLQTKEQEPTLEAAA